MMPMTKPGTAERLWSRVTEQANGCKTWTGCLDTAGYGQISVDGRMVLTHRLAWELTNGPIPAGLVILHRCDNPPCCNVERCLSLGTIAENIADRDAKRRQWNQDKTHCIHGHEFTPENTYVSPSGSRNCRTCRKVITNRHDAKRRAR